MINREKVAKMLREGFDVKSIAGRLGCSERTVIRVRKELNVIGKASGVDPEVEGMVVGYYAQFESLENAGSRFGLSRQVVAEKLKTKTL